ncbi:MAG: exodeoxyribonuclease VII small subunit [Candidatus Omnitrophica bacterium]|nr:exodeoxyribonuclease VII small subunit [Candidatus Omnitrophota bacterium]
MEEIESQSVDVDMLTAKVKRASFLIKWCQDRLKKTETEVTKILTDLDEKSEAPSPEG